MQWMCPEINFSRTILDSTQGFFNQSCTECTRKVFVNVSVEEVVNGDCFSSGTLCSMPSSPIRACAWTNHESADIWSRWKISAIQQRHPSSLIHPLLEEQTSRYRRRMARNSYPLKWNWNSAVDGLGGEPADAGRTANETRITICFVQLATRLRSKLPAFPVARFSWNSLQLCGRF